MQANEVIRRLNKEGFEAYYIGGYVRNILHNQFHNDNMSIKDIDIVTNASVEQIKQLFKDVDSRGTLFNVAIVKIDDFEFEVAQYRGESYPKGGSLRPDVVFNVQTLKEDVYRRDFTINGIAIDKDENVIDYTDGYSDIKNKVIKTIGNPHSRFSEDPLRIMRAFRFAAQLGYSISNETEVAIRKNLCLLAKIPHERMKEEVNKILRADSLIKTLIEMRRYKIYKKTFFNSITNKQIRLLFSPLSLPKNQFQKMLHKLSTIDRRNADLSEIYYILYSYCDYKKAQQELKDMMFLNEKEIHKTILLLKHSNIVFFQTSLDLYYLVRDIGEQRGRKYLQQILKSYKNLHDVSFNKLEEISKQPLFKSELELKGNDLLNIARERNMKPGKWVGKVLDEVQMCSIINQQFDLDLIIKNVVKREMNVK